MGELVKTDRDNAALKAAREEVYQKHGIALTRQLGSQPWKIQSEVMQRAHELRKDYE
jgi:hypothetical protein